MKPLVFNTESWHYKIATYKRDTWWSGRVEDKYKDICSYSRLVLFKLSIIAFLCIVAFLAVASVYDTGVYFVIGWIFGAGPDYYQVLPVLVWGGVIILSTFGIGIGGLIFLFVLGQVIRGIGYLIGPLKAISESKPSFISEAYKAFKEKTCVRIEFEKQLKDMEE